MYEGVPTLRLDVPTTATPEDLVLTVSQGIARGVQAIWLYSAPWGSSQFDHALMHVLADARFNHLPVLGLRKISDRAWSAVDVAWVVDCSELVDQPRAVAELWETIKSIGYRPRFAEIFVEKPHMMAASPTLLDMIYEEIAPEGGGWIYVDGSPNDWLAAVCGCASAWGVRRV